MKRFITLSTLFISPLICVVFLSLFINSSIIKNQALKIPDNKRILILGDSNPECAINDSLISNALNLSQSANSYFYSYLKLRQILIDDNNIDTVILGLAPHNIFAEIEKEWLLNNAHMQKMLPDYYPLMEKDDFALLLKNSANGVKQAFSSIIKGSIENIVDYLKGKKLDYGGYNPLEINDLKKDASEFTSKNSAFKIAKIESLYLRKIIEECEKNNLDLLFICTPKRAELWKSKNYGVDQFYSYYSNHFSHITFLDMHNFYIPDNGFGDLAHLNHQGAKIFSEYIENQGITQLTALHRFNTNDIYDSNTRVVK